MDAQTLVEGIEILIAILFFEMLVKGMIGLVFYILRSIGITTLARNRGMTNPWLIWIPVVGIFMTGAILDDINQKKGKKTYFRLILLIGNVWYFIPTRIGYAFLFDVSGTMPVDDASDMFMVFICIGGLIGLGLYVFKVIVLHQIFKNYRPQSATTWTLFCALPVTMFMQDIFPFVMRNDLLPWVEYWNPPQSGVSLPQERCNSVEQPAATPPREPVEQENAPADIRPEESASISLGRDELPH